MAKEKLVEDRVNKKYLAQGTLNITACVSVL